MGTVADGELVAIDDNGRPDFNMLHNSRSESSRIHYYVFDLLCCKGRDLTRLPLIERRALLKSLLAIHDKNQDFGLCRGSTNRSTICGSQTTA